MVEPTESEDLNELDRFIEAMIAIREEIRHIEEGTWPQDNNPVINAPHTAMCIAEHDWTRPYTREEAVFPLADLKRQNTGLQLVGSTMCMVTGICFVAVYPSRHGRTLSHKSRSKNV